VGLPPLLDSLDDSNTLGRCGLLRITTGGASALSRPVIVLRFDDARYALDFSDSVTRWVFAKLDAPPRIARLDSPDAEVIENGLLVSPSLDLEASNSYIQ